jgi:hypothetical protein
MNIKTIEFPRQMRQKTEWIGAFYHRFARLIILSAALCVLVLATRFFQYQGTTFKEVMSGIFVIGIYGILFVSFLVRIVLVFFGVFAIYRIPVERVIG